MCLMGFTLLLGNGKLLVVKMWIIRIYSTIMCSVFVRDTMKTRKFGSKYYFNYLVARVGLCLVLHPHLRLLFSLSAFVSQQLWCFCFQVCTAPPCQTTTSKKQIGEKLYKGLSAIPNFSSSFTGPQVGFTCSSM